MVFPLPDSPQSRTHSPSAMVRETFFSDGTSAFSCRKLIFSSSTHDHLPDPENIWDQPDPQQNIVLHMKADFADIGRRTSPPRPRDSACRRQFLTDLDTAGHQRHKTILQHFPAFLPPICIPRIFMAALIEAASSITVGKKRNMTDSGIMIFSLRRIRSMAAVNSLTVVVETR